MCSRGEWTEPRGVFLAAISQVEMFSDLTLLTEGVWQLVE